ncbi:phosphohistidine phosphatase SixA [Ornithinibacillus bavariensis]
MLLTLGKYENFIYIVRHGDSQKIGINKTRELTEKGKYRRSTKNENPKKECIYSYLQSLHLEVSLIRTAI